MSHRPRPVLREKVSPPSLERLPRKRIRDRVGALRDVGLGFVHGAAGIGKTTALLELADAWDGPTAWIRLDADDGSPERLAELLVMATALDGDHETVDDVLAVLSDENELRLLVLDDLHTIAGSPASTDLERLITYRPATLTILAASRFGPDIDSTHRLLAAQAVQLDFEDLRFRLWEVDDLLERELDVSIDRSELHQVSRYTDGWPAALRLFSVAARDASTQTRRRMIDGLKSRPTLAHGFLSQEVLATLDGDERDFLIRSSVLEQLDPRRCDQLLERSGSAAILRTLSARSIFADSVEATEKYRCHDLLRSHLLAELHDRETAGGVAALHQRAGDITYEEGALGEALRCYARADDLEAVRRVVSARGDELTSAGGTWWEVLPQGFSDNDPHVQMATARRHLRCGSLELALVAYDRADHIFTENHSVSQACRAERQVLRRWLDDVPGPRPGATEVTKALLQGRDPPRPPDAGSFNDALRQALAGRLRAAAAIARDLEARTTGLESGIAGFTRLFCDYLANGPEACSHAAQRRLQQTAKQIPSPALERLAQAISRSGVPADSHDVLAEEARRDGDALGEGLIHLLRGLALVHEHRAVPGPFIDAAEVLDGRYRALGLLATCLAGAAGAGPLDKDTVSRARVGGGLMRTLERAAALDRSDADATTQWVLDEAVGDATALVLALVSPAPAAEDRATPGADTGNHHEPAGNRIRVLGPFTIEVGGVAVEPDLTPGHRRVLAFFGAHAGQSIHVDTLIGAFWPEASPEKAVRNLQVAVSNARRALKALDAGDIERNGSRYRLQLAAGWGLDLDDLDSLLISAGDDLEAARQRIEAAQALHDDVCADLGAVDWAVELRRGVRLRMTTRTTAVARALLDIGDLDGAAAISAAGVEIDPSADELWQLAIATAQPARGRELNRRYEALLADLDVDTAAS